MISVFVFANEYPLDTNKDGKYDKWYVYTAGVVESEKSDENYDGKIDHITRFDANGKELTEEIDFNYDGEMDNLYEYSNGRLTFQKIDSNYDGKIDIWIYIRKGSQIEKYEQDTDFDGVIDKTRTFGL